LSPPPSLAPPLPLLLPVFPEPSPPDPEFAWLFPPLLPAPVDDVPPPCCEPSPVAAALTGPSAVPTPPEVQPGPPPPGHPVCTCATTITPEFAASVVEGPELVCAPAIAA
jgi:hypothetical protein